MDEPAKDYEVPPRPEFNHQGFLASLPGWAKGLVFALTTIPLAVAISGQILGVRAGDYLDQYMDIQLEAMRNVSDESADKIISALGLRLDEMASRLATVAKQSDETAAQVGAISQWACDNKLTGPEPSKRPDFCE